MANHIQRTASLSLSALAIEWVIRRNPDPSDGPIAVIMARNSMACYSMGCASQVLADTEAEQEVPHVNSLLGTQWQGEPTASWVKFRDADTDSDLLCRLHSQMPPCTPASGCARGRGPGFNHSRCGSECLFKLRLIAASSAHDAEALPRADDWRTLPSAAAAASALVPLLPPAAAATAARGPSAEEARAMSETWSAEPSRSRSLSAAFPIADWLDAAHDSRRASLASAVRRKLKPAACSLGCLFACLFVCGLAPPATTSARPPPTRADTTPSPAADARPNAPPRARDGRTDRRDP